MLVSVDSIDGSAPGFAIQHVQFAYFGDSGSVGAVNGDYSTRGDSPIFIPGLSCADWQAYVNDQGDGQLDSECGYYWISGPADPLDLINYDLMDMCG